MHTVVCFAIGLALIIASSEEPLATKIDRVFQPEVGLVLLVGFLVILFFGALSYVNDPEA